jgi:ABC-type multidrug transport system ATPase subunit
MSSTVIRTEGLIKSYGAVPVLQGLNLHVRKGEIYGFLGPNGSGKSTTIRILLGLEKPSGGSYAVFDQPEHEPEQECWQRIGLVPEHQYLYRDMTAQEYLDFFARLYQLGDATQRALQWLETLDLAAYSGVRIAHLSKGERQRLNIARALIHDPELVIMDEPIQGLDPPAVRDLRDLIKTLNQTGKTVFLSSHVLSEVEKTADRIGILYQGQLLVEDSVDGIRRKLGKGIQFLIEVVGLTDGMVRALAAEDCVQSIHRQDSMITVTVDEAEDYRLRLSRIITEGGGYIVGWKKAELSLEEAFLAITDKEISLLADQSSTQAGTDH